MSMLESKVSEEVGSAEQPLDREKTCPLLLRMFCSLNGKHHFRSEYDRGATPSSELQIYTWMDATLRELTNLIKEVNKEARRKGTTFNFSIVYPDSRAPIYRMRDIGQTCSGSRGNADNYTLRSRGFVIGDYIDVAISIPKSSGINGLMESVFYRCMNEESVRKSMPFMAFILNYQNACQMHDEDDYEVENQFIFRAPNDEVADEIEKMFLDGGEELNNALKIQFEPDMRSARVFFRDSTFDAKLLDLPCIVESYKTFDKTTFYKTGDISQILICESTQNPLHSKSTNTPINNEKRYEFPDGLTPPMKNVRERRFRKLMQQKPFDYTEVEKEVRRLFRADSEALKVSWELITETAKERSQPETLSLETTRIIDQNSTEDDQIYEATYLFGDLSDLDEEDDDEAATPIAHNPPSIVDNSTSFPSPEDLNHSSDHESNNAFLQDFSNDEISKSSCDVAAAPDDANLTTQKKENADEQQQVPTKSDSAADISRTQILASLANLRTLRTNAEKHLAKLDNPMLRARILENIRNFMKEEQQKMLQLEKLDEKESINERSSEKLK